MAESKKVRESEEMLRAVERELYRRREEKKEESKEPKKPQIAEPQPWANGLMF